MKKITLIAPSSFGYIDFLANTLKNKPNVKVTHINYSNFKFQYTSLFQKIKNGFGKIFLQKNIKDTYRSKCILDIVSKNGKQDFIVVIRPDLLELETLITLKKYTSNFDAFYFDAIHNYPLKKQLIPYFDKVYSYEKDDINKYNLNFTTNFIYDQSIPISKEKYTVFNISSYDSRFESIEKIANHLLEQNISYKILVRKERPIDSDSVEIIKDYIPLEQVKDMIAESSILLDIQMPNQKGLSFRVFEALGYQKKLITTNTDIVNYDFYNSNNIYIIDDINQIEIPKSFFQSEYMPISEDILYKYTLDGWILEVFKIT